MQCIINALQNQKKASEHGSHARHMAHRSLALGGLDIQQDKVSDRFSIPYPDPKATCVCNFFYGMIDPVRAFTFTLRSRFALKILTS